MQHKDIVILNKILSEIDMCENLLGNISLEEFLSDEKTKRAVSMTIINIGELTKNVSIDIRQEYSDIPWKLAAGLRDVAAHKYQTLRMEDIYKTAVEDIPKFGKQIMNILKDI